MSIPGTDKAAVRQVIRGLLDGGYHLASVYDGEEEYPVATEDEAMSHIFDVDMAHLHVVNTDTGVTGWVWFVLGNSPEEVAADYTVNLEHVLGPICEHWQDPDAE